MMPTIRHKSSDTLTIKIAQYLTGYAERGKASGIFDADFVAHVVAWQGNHRLTPDGVIGAASWTTIAANAPICSTRKNAKSAAVCALQLLIGGLTADGVFGSHTKAAVVAYQTAKGLTADGIVGGKTWAALIAGTGAGHANYVKPMDFKQYDSRWGRVVYTSCRNKRQTIRNSGCGPTAAADVIATLKDASVTPKALAALAVANGFRTATSGTAWGFFRWLAQRYGFKGFVQGSTLAALKACLDAGGYVVCSMGPDYWTKGGHYITAWKYDGNYIYCNDPASSVRKRQKIGAFMGDRKQFFCFLP